MPLENCIIKLNSDSTGSFYCGDIVTGTVILRFKQKQKIERMDFLVCGTSKASWTRPSPTLPHIRFYSQKKNVLHIVINLFDSIQGKTVNPGEYEYPFHFALPHDLPSSFESSIARVYYCVKVKFSGTCRGKKIQPFVVLGNVNLNHIEKYLEPSVHELQKGKISLSVKTYTGFSYGQTIPIAITITNERKVKVYKISVSLIQKLRYSVTEGYADAEKKICEMSKKHLQSLEKEICYLNLVIPNTVPSSIHTREPMIAISYILRIQVKLTFQLTSIFKDIPVTVATVPLIHSGFQEL